MAFIRGRTNKVFITTENTSGGVILTGTSPDSSTVSCGLGPSASNVGVGKLGSVTTSSNVNDLIPFVEGIDVVKGWEDETANFYGTQKEYHIPQRKKWEATVTLKTEHKGYSLLAMAARFGVTGSTTGMLHTGLTEIKSDSGYRIYIYDGTKWDVFYHGIIPADGFTEKHDPMKAMIQTIKFVGNEWSTSLGDGAISSGQAQE